MKLSWISALCLIAAAALPAAAHEVVYEATLSGGNESPANASPGIGTVKVTIDLDVLSMEVQADFSGLQGTSTAAHIHCCLVPSGPLNVGVATAVPSFPGFPTGVTSGSYDQTFDLSQASSYNPAFVTANTDVSGALNALLNGLAGGATYFNIHTSTSPGGEIRGFLQAVPEPELLGLVGVGLVALSLVARRRA
ncbi:MAG: CHRD domain-containing protein [Myxococcota bacterium]